MIYGVTLVLTDGNLISVQTPASFATLGRGEFVTVGFLLSRTRYGRMMYAAGGNPEAARLSGIRVNLVKGSTFAISGLGAGIGGVILASRVATGQADAGGLNIALDAVAGIVIGARASSGAQARSGGRCSASCFSP